VSKQLLGFFLGRDAAEFQYVIGVSVEELYLYIADGERTRID
jgi:hypothetical protein